MSDAPRDAGSVITHLELHRVGDPCPVGRGDRGPLAGDGGPISSGDVLAFAPIERPARWTYLDECKARGVYSEHLELLDEHATLSTEIAARDACRQEIDVLKAEGYGQGDRPKPSKISHIADRGPRTLQHAIDAEYARLKAAAAAIEASGIAGPRFRWIVAVLITARLDADIILKLVAATFGDATLARSSNP